jgi:sigma-B regulation protein RsbU (phosphoserine phosphatase)
MEAAIGNKNEKLILETLRIANSALKLKNLKLNSLLEITNAINNNFSTKQLLKIFEFVLRNQLSISKLMLFTHNQTWQCELSYGLPEDMPSFSVEQNLLLFKEVTEVKDNTKLFQDHFEVIIPVYHKQTPLAFLLLGDIKEDILESAKTKHIPFIITLTNIIVVAIENKKLAKDNVKQAAVRKEMELAKEMQEMLFPVSLPKNEKIECAAEYKPMGEVGGDYYDFIKISENEVVLCMADVSGKGVSAALLMSNFQANIRALLNYSTSLTDLVRDLNKRIIESTKGDRFVTLFIAKYNMITRVLTYVNAGQTPPLLLSDKTSILLTTGCPGLGMLDEMPSVKEGIISINKNAVLLCYTDGVVELENEKGKEFGTSKLELILLDNPKASMKEVNQTIIHQLENFKGSRPFVDDIALFGCRFF